MCPTRGMIRQKYPGADRVNQLVCQLFSFTSTCPCNALYFQLIPSLCLSFLICLIFKKFWFREIQLFLRKAATTLECAYLCEICISFHIFLSDFQKNKVGNAVLYRSVLKKNNDHTLIMHKIQFLSSFRTRKSMKTESLFQEHHLLGSS